MIPNSMFPFAYRTDVGFYGEIKDYNEAIVPGIYKIDGDMAGAGNEPPASNFYGSMIVCEAENLITQIFMAGSTENCVYIRNRGVKGSWSNWTSLI